MQGERTSRRSRRGSVRARGRSRRDFLTIMGGAGLAAFAAACGGESDKTRETAPAGGTSAAGAAPTQVRVTKVAYISGDASPPEMEWHKRFAEAFKAALPQYEAEGSHYSNSTDYQTKLQTSLATGAPPDMIFRNSDNVPELWDKGLLMPVNDVMEDIFKAIGGKDKFTKAALDRYTVGGEVISVPMMGGGPVWWFRTDLMREAGLTPPADKWDWNFLLRAVKATHKPPQVYGIGFPTARNAAPQYLTGLLIHNNGGSLVSPDLKDVTFDSQEVRDAIDLLRELNEYNAPGTSTWGNPEQVNAIVRGNIAMGHYWGRVFPNVYNENRDLAGKLGNTLVPYNKQPSSWGGTGGHAVIKAGKNPQGAKELAKFSMRKEQYISYMRAIPGFYSPAVPEWGTDPLYTNDEVLKAYDPKLLTTMAEAGKHLYDMVKEGPQWEINRRGGTLWGSLIVTDVVQRVLVGKESTRSAVSWGAQQIKEAMRG